MAASAACGTSTLTGAVEAARQAAATAARGLAGAPADLALVFVTPEHVGDAVSVAEAVHELLGPRVLAGASGESVIGGGRELEGVPGVSVLAASLPGTRVQASHVTARRDLGGAVSLAMPAEFAPPPPGRGALVTLCDPYTFPVDAFLELLRREWGGAVAVGGLASGGAAPGEHVLLCGREALREGAVLLELDGGVELETVVSQGCAPIGPEMVVTAGEGHAVLELAGRPAYERLVEVLTGLDPDRQRQAASGILAGLVIDENTADYGRDDYLIRGVLGADPSTGAVYIGDRPRIGQTMRFHVRDAASADEDLRQALRDERALPGRLVAGLLFACNGRGTRMFPQPDHDAGAVEQELGAIPTAGMFCSGEIGPVGGVNFIHGFTATMALLVDRTQD
ncbi:MAG: FIST signal transduction protein [Gaiellales bacterium]